MQDHARALGQKYLGIRPQGSHIEEMFRDTTYHGDASHPVPVSNFLNAQCTLVCRN
jgi:saccharopepsin